MADQIFNIAKGRFIEFVSRVNANDPSTSTIEVRLLASSGVESDATLKDVDTFTALVAGATNFATNTGYSAKVLTDASGMTVTYDDTNDWAIADCADQTWTAVANDGTGAIGDVVFGYDAVTGSGTDADIVPISMHDFSVTPNGGDITAVMPSGGWGKAA